MNRPSPRFLSQLAHDLRSPLNVIGSTLTELSTETGPGTADRDKIVSLSQRAVGRLLSLSDRLALAARLESPFELALAPVDLVKTAKDTLAQFGTQVRQRISVASTFPETAMKVSADGALLRALLLELLTNANRFARRQ